jgi:hypothetical protein
MQGTFTTACPQRGSCGKRWQEEKDKLILAGVLLVCDTLCGGAYSVCRQANIISDLLSFLFLSPVHTFTTACPQRGSCGKRWQEEKDKLILAGVLLECDTLCGGAYSVCRQANIISDLLSFLFLSPVHL